MAGAGGGAAADRPNGSGTTVPEAESHVRRLRGLFPPAEDGRGAFERGAFEAWPGCAVARGVRGLAAFDVRPAAARERHGPSHVLTFNERDFRGFEGVAVLDPAAVAP